MFTRLRTRTRLLLAAFALAAALAGGAGVNVAEATPAVPPRTQVATATGGMYAQGSSGYVEFPDGTTRWFTAMLVVPDGTVVGSPAVEDADLREPWAILSQQVWGEGEGGGLSGGPEVCHRFVNPTSFSTGHAGEPVTWPAGGPRPTWEGTSFDVTCDDGTDYEFYRVHFEPHEYRNGHRAFVRSRSTLGFPQTDVRYWGWSAPYDVNGALTAEPRGVQSAAVSVCGHRWVQLEDDEEPRLVADCYGPGLGRIFPAVDTLTTTLYTVAER